VILTVHEAFDGLIAPGKPRGAPESWSKNSCGYHRWLGATKLRWLIHRSNGYHINDRHNCCQCILLVADIAKSPKQEPLYAPAMHITYIPIMIGYLHNPPSVSYARIGSTLHDYNVYCAIWTQPRISEEYRSVSGQSLWCCRITTIKNSVEIKKPYFFAWSWMVSCHEARETHEPCTRVDALTPPNMVTVTSSL